MGYYCFVIVNVRPVWKRWLRQHKLTFVNFPQANGLAAQGKYVSSVTGGAAGQSLYVADHSYWTSCIPTFQLPPANSIVHSCYPSCHQPITGLRCLLYFRVVIAMSYISIWNVLHFWNRNGKIKGTQENIFVFEEL